MKYSREYRDFKAARRYAQTIRRVTSHNWTIMEACGWQTHSIVRFGIDDLLPDEITLIEALDTIEIADTDQIQAAFRGDGIQPLIAGTEKQTSGWTDQVEGH